MSQDHTTPGSLALLHPMLTKEISVNLLKRSSLLHGSHRMSLKRAAKHPEYSRPYVSGDPLSLIDWKAYGRTDQLIIREQRDEASAKICIVTELTETMIWPDVNQDISLHALPQKSEIALRIACHLAHFHLRMGDRVRLCFLLSEAETHSGYVWVPVGPSDILNLFHRLRKDKFAATAVSRQFRKAPCAWQDSEQIYWLGDTLSQSGYQAIIPFQNRGILFHILSSRELDLSWLEDDECYFDQDQRSRARKEFSGSHLKKSPSVHEQIIDWTEKLRSSIVSSGCWYFLLHDKTPLNHYFKSLDDIFSRKQKTMGRFPGR
ncbi:MAG: DUF58 domain-containing protein [Deltaproteobacteria bacterium]|nr:DUF58 domain-containing protein [Deltaproteobacteria bacterium]